MLCLLLAAGCAGNGHTAAREEAQATAAAVPTASIEATATPPVPPPDQPPDQPPARAPEPLPAPRPAPLPASAHASRTDPPPLDLGTLETRLRETKAIGVFTKLTVKNQIDDLLDRIRAYHEGQLQTSLAELRHAYDMLVLKMMALLQDADAALARALAASRESIWGILADRERFSKVQS